MTAEEKVLKQKEDEDKAKKAREKICKTNESLVWNIAQGDILDEAAEVVEIVTNPYPNEHALRLTDPDSPHEVGVRRTKGSGNGMVRGVKIPASISVVWYLTKDADGKTIPIAQALRFPTSTWTEAEAKKWIKDNPMKSISFTPAAPEEKPSKNEAEPGTFSGLRHLMSNLVRFDTMDTKSYLVVPTILIVEGVHNQLFYPAKELKKFPDSWNGRPVVINHPELNGSPITANKPEIVEKQTVGQVFNVKWESPRLKGEVWIDVEKCKGLCPDILKKLEANAKIEVSTGLFTESDGEAGDWNGEQYLGTVFNYRPDHLALLPDSKGACSWEDGGGMPRVNSETNNKEEEVGMKNKVVGLFKDLGKALGFSLNELSHDSLHGALQDKVREAVKPKDGEWAGVRAVYDKHVIYSHETKDGSKLFKQAYAVDAKDSPSLVGEPMEVMMKTDFVPVTNNTEVPHGAEAPASNNNAANGAPVSNQGTGKEEGTQAMDKKQRVAALIARNCGWVPEDEGMLVNMSDAQLDRLEKAAQAPAPVVPAATVAPVVANATPAAAPAVPAAVQEAAKPETLEGVLAGLKDNGLKNQIAQAVAQASAYKATLISHIMANKSNSFSEADLQGKDVVELGKLIKLSGTADPAPVMNFSGKAPAVPAVVANATEDQNKAPDMPTFNWAKK